MKKKLLLITFITFLIIIFARPVSLAWCLNCTSMDHDACTSKGSWYAIAGSSTHHGQNCCCGERINSGTHSFSWSTSKSATCTSKGSQKGTCGTCSYSTTRTTDALGHNWGTTWYANGSAGHRQKCSRCSSYNTTYEHTSFTLKTSLYDPHNTHSYWCNTCLYETDEGAHKWAVKNVGSWHASASHYCHDKYCSVCDKITVYGEDCTFTSKVTKQPTCTATGTRKYTCTFCGFSYTSSIAKIDHSWSDWNTTKTEHWKTCTYGCGTEDSRGNHVDTSPRNGRCDTCNYLMYVLPVANISADVAVKEGETANFSISMTAGSQPLTYQWYYKTSSTGTGNTISGATSSSYSVTTTKSMNGRYYYCMVSNPGGDYITSAAKLTVYYDFTIGTHPQNVNLKNGETGTFTVGIGTAGNPNTYTYQWYIANSETGAGSRISGATSSSYSVTPTKNVHAEYYYCVVSNGQYSQTSNRAKLTADITLPEITMGSFNQNVIINDTATIKVPFTVSDTGEGYTEDNNNFTASDIIIKVGGVTNTNVSKTLTYTGSSGNNYNYELTLSNVSGNGKLSFEVPAGSVKDNFNNTNTLKTFSTNVTIDNIAPVITVSSVTGDINDVYINSEDQIIIRIVITEAVSMNTNELTVDDIIVKVGGNPANSDIEKTLNYIEKTGNDYVYELTIENIQGDGGLSINIPDSSVKDTAGNENVETEITIKTTTGGENIIVDNTVPVINSLVTTLGGYNSSRDYPTSIDARHNGWAKEDIYVQINATDNQTIDYYMKSIDNNTNYSKMTSYQEIISNSIDATIYYKVVDMAGNSSEIHKTIKLDKITPNKPEMSLFEQRMNGIVYEFNPDIPSDKSIYIIPNASTIVDTGAVMSGIEKDVQYTYYTVTMYEDITKALQMGDTITYEWNEGVLLNQGGYYEITIFMTDIAGNSIAGDLYKVYIDKKAENTIKISNINDIGSGIKRVTIRVYKSDLSGNKTSEYAVDPITIDNPYKEIIKNVRLGNGKFYVEVILEDKVGLETVLEKTIINSL